MKETGWRLPVTDRARYRRIALYAALVLALALLFLDRTAAWLHRPGTDSRAVVIYTATWCPYCKRLRAFLDDHRIPYTDYDVEHSLSGGMGFWTLRGRGVPVAVVGADIIYGLDIMKMQESLRRLGYETGSPPPATPGLEEAGSGDVSRLWANDWSQDVTTRDEDASDDCDTDSCDALYPCAASHVGAASCGYAALPE